MAKLTAIFDMQDKITAKLKKMHGNLEKIEKSRKTINQPMTITVRDRATKNLQRLHNFVRKDIAKKHDLVLGLSDQATKPLKAFNRFVERRMPKTYNLVITARDNASKQLKSVNDYLKRRMPKTYEMVIQARDRSRTVLERIRKNLLGNILGTHMFTVMARDRATPTIHNIANYGRRLLGRGYNFTVQAFDQATRTVGRISSYLGRSIPAYRDFTVRAIDRATSIIGSVKNALFSIPAMITVGLAFVGAGKLSESTLGAAMNFEGYEVAMTHWLDGNKQQADELVKWMGRFADMTPFSSAELFPALSRGIGVAGGDVREAQKLLEISANMAALTPGKTVEDAMEALADARMGEFARLPEFGFKISKAQFDEIGWEGLINQIDETFEGGAKKFSQTASGQISTLKGYTSTLFREAGTGILTSMKPRLDQITSWIDNNQDKWGEWKNTVRTAGEEASEWLFSKLEGAFAYIRDNYLENEEFKNLDFEGKIKFIMGDLGNWWDNTGRPWLAEVAKDVGSAFFKGIVWGVKEGIKGIGSMWKDAFQNPSTESFGSATVATAIAASIASLVLSPLLSGISLIGKGAKGIWDIGKKTTDFFGKNKTPKTTPVPATTKGPKSTGRRGTFFSGLFGGKGGKKPVYTNPWFDKGTKNQLNTPNQFKGKGKFSLSGIGKNLGKFGKELWTVSKKVPVLGTLLGLGTIFAAPEGQKMEAAGSVGGGLGGTALGSAIGTAILPGVGTVVGGILGGFGGSALGEKIAGMIDVEGITEKFSELKTTISNTLFSGEWWSGKWNDSLAWAEGKWGDITEGWDSFKETVGSTVFSANWWAEKWGFAVGWAEGKWEGISESWDNFKETVGSTIFSGDWWKEKWDGAVAWGSDKWSGIVETWDDFKESVGSTVFNGDWWAEKWDGAVAWGSSKWSDLVDTWDSFKESVGSTIFNSEWWQGKWKDAAEWGSEKWNGLQDTWEGFKTKIGDTVFDKDWWQGKWKDAAEWGKGIWSDVKDWFGGLGESYNKGKEQGKEASKYANGGMITRPHLGLVGESGPEMIIPLSQNRRGRAMDLYNKTGQMLGVKPYANGGLVGGSVKTPKAQTVQASVNVGSISVQGMDKEAKSYGESFATAVASGINGNVIPIDSWKKKNIESPMQGVIKDALTYGANLVTSFATGQNSKTTGTDVYLSANVHNPFNDTKAKGSGWGSGTIAEFVSGMKSQAAQVKEAAKHLAQQVEKTFREELGIHSPSQVMMKLGEFTSLGIVKGLSKVDVKKFVENQAGSIAAAFAGLASVGGNVQSWLKAAIAITGVPMSWLGPLSIMAQRESGGNPRAINLWDINAKRGTPSKGLMQTIDPTFNAYKMPGLNDIWNPVHNAVAAIRYILARYGTVFNTPGIKSMMRGGPYKGYARGTKGPLPRTEIAWVGEEGPELVKLPKGSEIFPHEESVEMLSGSNKVPAEQMQAIVSPRSGRTAKGKIRDIIVQITGDNHFNGDMDIEKFGDKIVSIIEKALEDEYFEGGEMAIYD